MNIKSFIISLFIGSSLLFSCNSETKEETETIAQEESKPVEKKVSIEKIEEGIKKYILETTEKSGGTFNIKNDSLDLDLRLVRVHTEYLSHLGPGSYFACVDLADDKGDIYDVDFFLEGTEDNMNVVRTDIHKLNGKPFYSWKQDKNDKTWSIVPIKNAGGDLLGVVEGEDEFEFYYKVMLPKIDGKGEIWIPIAESDQFQDVKMLSVNIPTKEKYLTDDQFGNKVLYLKLDERHSHKEIAISYSVKRLEKSPYKAKKGEDLNQYLKANTLIPVGDQFKEIALFAIGNKTKNDPLIKARALYDYVIDSMKYIKNEEGTYGTGDAVYACDAQSGNCSEFHSYFIALARSVDIPARFAIGASIPSDRDEGGINGYHCWAEFYAEGKWWPVDISEANKYTALSTYYFGHHGANRIELSRGRDIKFNPGPASGEINFLAYPVMEIDEFIVRPKTTFTFERKKEKNS
ncbi:transglutaminase domain-containing protein [Brumimicrobium glaciale]|uniref:Transglutaminase domain-containing protein n=1 Tax=Brumimicrobium glaciale TaxID=200475 RepID=A0A4Q4KQQ5_9FLAO|nr:transglutaminase domain-containing protein [Brumimicrobium glaciale]RYM35523.1 transglutaminase domain-containing protein [Brumimicrobium glaciale]